MSYTKHNFQTGNKLYASELNEMDEQIYKNESDIVALSEQIADLDATELREYVEEQVGVVVFDENMSDAFEYSTGFLNQNGKAVTSTSGYVTDFIPVEVGDIFVWSGSADLSGSYGVCEYNENKTFIKGSTLVEKSYSLTKNVRYTVTEGAYVRFSTFTSLNDASLVKMKNLDGICELVKKTDEYLIDVEPKFLIKGSGAVSTNVDNAIVTQFIPAKQNDAFLVTSCATSSTCGVAFYNANKVCIATGLYNADGSNFFGNMEKVVAPSGTAYVRFSSYWYQDNPLKVWKYEPLPLAQSDYQLYEYVKELRKSNCLFGKKYVACGDSFTAGNFSEKTEESWDETKAEYKTYCWHIADRNKMTLVNEAKSGSTMYNNGDENAFSITRYTKVPTDADYITICFGLNETSAPIGTLQDTTNETVMGAWNIVLEYLITNMPYAKIGIIIPDAWCSSAIREALIDVAEYWGIPYLDLKGDTKVPMLIGGRMGTTVSAKAMELRNNAFQISAEDSHPNPKAHLYRSTIIENFLRSL